MSNPKVYLAGPIAGCEYDAAIDWRDEAARWFHLREIITLSPMRAKSQLAGGVISHDFRNYNGIGYGPFYTSQGIMTRDFNDVKTCDVALVNLLGSKRISLGTVMELAWMYAFRKPVVIVIEPSTVSVYKAHPMVGAALGALQFPSLMQGINGVCTVLGVKYDG